MLTVYTNLNRILAETVKYPASERERQLFCSAIDMALNSQQRFRVGAVATNYFNSRAIHAYNSREQHAEMALISSRRDDSCLRNATVAVARLGKKNDWRCSYPCEDCHRALKRFGVARVICIDEYHSLVAVNL